MDAGLSIRCPQGLRERLKKVAEDNGRSLTQEVLERLRGSFRDVDDVDRAARALSYLVTRVINTATLLARNSNILSGRPEVAWHTDPWVYRAIQSAIVAMLDTLEPKGPAHAPATASQWREYFRLQGLDYSDDDLVWVEDPERSGEHAWEIVMTELYSPMLRPPDFGDHRDREYAEWRESPAVRKLEYSMDRVREDLGVRVPPWGRVSVRVRGRK